MKPLTPKEKAKLRKIWEEGPPSASQKSKEFQASEKGKAGGSETLPKEEGLIESDKGLPQEIENSLPEQAILPASIAGSFLGNPRNAIKKSKDLLTKLRKEGVPIAQEAMDEFRKAFRGFGDDIKALYKGEDDFVEKAAKEKFKQISKSTPGTKTPKVGSREYLAQKAQEELDKKKLNRSGIAGSGNSPTSASSPILETWSKKIYDK